MKQDTSSYVSSRRKMAFALWIISVSTMLRPSIGFCPMVPSPTLYPVAQSQGSAVHTTTTATTNRQSDTTRNKRSRTTRASASANAKSWRIVGRGGAVSRAQTTRHSSSTNDIIPPLITTNGIDQTATAHTRGMRIALASAYFAVMFAKCALPSVLSMLTSTESGLTFSPTAWNNASPKQLIARQLTLSTLAIALGKVLLGPVIDHFGGIVSLKTALALLAVLLGIVSCAQPFLLFALCWVGVDFIFSSCWAASIKAIHETFPKEEWSRHIGSLAAAARAGNAAAFAFFAMVLKFFDGRMRQSWRPVFALSGLLQLVPIVLLSYFGRKAAPVNEHEYELLPVATTKKPSLGASLATLQREAKTPEFWLHLVSRSTLMVFASFLLFVPTLMSQVYGTSPGFAAQSGSIYALGCLLSVTTISQVYPKLSRNGKIRSILMLLGAATVSSVAQLGHMAGQWHLSAAASAAFLFLWGFAFSVPFYIPSSLYALSRGGAESAATIADVFDIGGFALLAAFNGYVAGIAHATPAAWIPTFQITTGCAVAAMLSLSLAVRFE